MGLGLLLGCSDVTARRLALGIRQADAVTCEKIVKVTGGAVSILDLHAARLAYERAQTPQFGEGGGEGGRGEGAASGRGATLGEPAAPVTANSDGSFA